MNKYMSICISYSIKEKTNKIDKSFYKNSKIRYKLVLVYDISTSAIS